MNIGYMDVVGSKALSEVEARLAARGYTLSHSGLSPGTYTSHRSDGAPGWTDSMYEVAVALLPGHTLATLMEGIA